MSEREEFDKWCEFTDASNEKVFRAVQYEAWKACSERKQQQLDELAAQNAQMREALESCYEDWNSGRYGTSSSQYYDSEKVKKALSLQQPAALREIEARVLEEAASQFDNQYTDSCPSVNISKELCKMAAAKRRQIK